MHAIDTIWPDGWPHEEPDQPLSITEAHHAMQRHRACLREECDHKRSAWDILVAAGRIMPDVGRTHA